MQLTDTIPFANGLFSLSNIDLKAVPGVGLVSFCDGNFLGINMASNANVSKPTSGSSSGGSLLDKLKGFKLGMRSQNTKLTAVTQSPKMWPNAPKLVMDKLGSSVFPTFDIKSVLGEPHAGHATAHEGFSCFHCWLPAMPAKRPPPSTVMPASSPP